ncbi:MAG: tol-pal system YbgF family protein [Myxococcota bacterium]
MRVWTLFGLVFLLDASAHAQSIRSASEAYNAKNFTEAAYQFFELAQGADAESRERYQAEYYLAQSLYRAGYLFPAFQYYAEVFTQGDAHPFFLRSATGLLRVAERLGDTLVIPQVLNAGYVDAFAQLKADDLNAINYLIGLLENRNRDYETASRFFAAITDTTSPYYVKAQYHLAIIAVRSAVVRETADYGQAIRIFDNIQSLLQRSNEEEDEKLVRLAILGKARAYYSQGDFDRSVRAYESVPRFSDDWFDALYESGWAYFQTGQFGRALGAVHSVHSPYFDERFRPESFVLKATTYFQVCHFDRVRKTLDDFFRTHEPMLDALRRWLDSEIGDAEYVTVMTEGAFDFPDVVRLRVLGNGKFQRYLNQLQRADQEVTRARRDFRNPRFRSIMLELLVAQRAQWLSLTGRLTESLIRRHSAALEDFVNQARIIQFETADAERKMLEAGRDITKGPRAKGPRPVLEMPGRQQYWAFQGEYWVDELGYYQHSIADECIPEIFD